MDSVVCARAELEAGGVQGGRAVPVLVVSLFLDYGLLSQSQVLALFVVDTADFNSVQARACPFHLPLCDLGLCSGQCEKGRHPWTG